CGKNYANRRDQQRAHQQRPPGPQTRRWNGPHQRPKNGPQAAFSIGVKFCACAGIFAAPREVWASALKASKPASRIAAKAIKVTVSLRISVLPSLAKTVSHKKHFAKRGHSQFQKGPLRLGGGQKGPVPPPHRNKSKNQNIS